MAAGNRFVFPEATVTLNNEQAAIVRQPPFLNLRILASAGSGKTTTLTTRIAHLLTDPTIAASPDQIILLTFTHNAAAVMRSRLEALVGTRRILCGTFHSLSQQILRVHNPDALTDIYHVDELPLKALDWLRTPAGRTWASSLRWIFIDEFQDINDTQYDFIRALHCAPDTTSVTIVGDDAQNIYTWRGSCVDYILNFHRRFPGVADFQLSTNYRSSGAIVAVANSIMRFIPTLPHKELMSPAPAAEQGARPEVHYFARTAEERDWVAEAATRATGPTVILSKFNSVLYAYEETLLRMGARVRFIQEATDDTVTTSSGATESADSPRTRTIYLSTFHGSKGLEWDNVFLVRMNDEVFPQQKDEDSILQERRLFYVAVTRARQHLTITYSRHERSLSRFVREIHRPLIQWFRLPQYELSQLSGGFAPATVSDWIGYLAGEDYRTIKRLGVLPPAFLTPTATTATVTSAATTTATPYVTPYWWAEQGLSNEFSDFLRAFWHREIAAHRPASGGQWDRDAHRVIWTIKIAAEDAAVFETYKPLFEALTEHFFGATPPGDPPPQISYVEVLAAMAREAPGTHFDQPTVIRIIQIIHKMRTMLYNLRFAAVRLQDFQFAPIRHTPPQETRCDLIRAWRIYTNGRHFTLPDLPLEELNATYQVALAGAALAAGRSGVLIHLPGEREWTRCREFLRLFAARAETIATSAPSVLCRVSAEVAPGVTAQADMIVGTTVWFLAGGENPTELQRLDRALQMLLTTHALREAGHVITDITLYQMLTGQTQTWSVRDWTPTAAGLLTAFIQARVGHAADVTTTL